MLYVPTHVKDQSPLLTAATTLVCLSLSLYAGALCLCLYAFLRLGMILADAQSTHMALLFARLTMVNRMPCIEQNSLCFACGPLSSPSALGPGLGRDP